MRTDAPHTIFQVKCTDPDILVCQSRICTETCSFCAGYNQDDGEAVSGYKWEQVL